MELDGDGVPSVSGIAISFGLDLVIVVARRGALLVDGGVGFV
jgi:hypothetical protein